MITVHETKAFGQIVTAVLDESAVTVQGSPKILDIRKGEVSEHAKQAARYHAKKLNQGMIKITRVNGPDSHMPTVEKNHD